MTCYHPVDVWQLAPGLPISFRENGGIKFKIPCGGCIGCRLERSRQWAVRCIHESQMHEHNSFITLTYSSENLPKNLSLSVPDFQKFMKRLRKAIKTPVRYYMCGEYGDQNYRPHYHACLFGYDFPDKILFKVSNGNNLYISQQLIDIWGKGHCLIGDVTFESAAYCARYVMKKITGKMAENGHYDRVDEDTGEVYSVLPEYNAMSRRPGIGKTWYDNYKSDVYPYDEVVSQGKMLRPPRFYDRCLSSEDIILFEEIKQKRYERAQKNLDNSSPDRLNVREACKQAQLDRLVRDAV